MYHYTGYFIVSVAGYGFGVLLIFLWRAFLPYTPSTVLPVPRSRGCEPKFAPARSSPIEDVIPMKSRHARHLQQIMRWSRLWQSPVQVHSAAFGAYPNVLASSSCNIIECKLKVASFLRLLFFPRWDVSSAISIFVSGAAFGRTFIVFLCVDLTCYEIVTRVGFDGCANLQN